MMNVGIGIKVDTLAEFTKCKYDLLKETRVLLEEQSNYIFSKDYINLTKCLDKTDEFIEELKEVDIEIDKLRAEFNTYSDDEDCSNITYDLNNLNEEIKKLANDIYHTYLKNQEQVEILLTEVKENIVNNNLNRKCLESYHKVNIFEDSLFFDQNR